MILYDRQLGLFDPTKDSNQWPIVLVGAGTIGSWTALCLAKMGLKEIKLIDFDKVEPQNIPNQFYKPNQTDTPKVYALRFNVFELTEINCGLYEFRFADFAKLYYFTPVPNTVLICTADNMAVRKEMWEYAKKWPGLVKYIDARTGGNAAKIYTVDPVRTSLAEKYESTLHPDDISYIPNDEARRLSDVPCTERSIIDVSMLVAGAIGNIVRLMITTHSERYETVIDMRNGLIFQS